MIVSVIMMTYGHEKFITKAIEGVLMQEVNFDIELIIADDCSPDNTKKIVEEILHTHPKANIIKYTKHKHNIGMNANFDWAFKQCKGIYIAICEGDDYWIDPFKLSKQISFLDSNPDYSMCFHNALEISDVNLSHKKLFKDNLKEKDYTGSEILLEWMIPTASVVFRKLSFQIDLLSEYSSLLYGDIVLFLDLSIKGKIKCIDITGLSVYRRHDGGATFFHNFDINFVNKKISHYWTLNKLFNNRFRNEVKFLVCRFYIDYSSYFYNKKILESFKCIIRSFYVSPSITLKLLVNKVKC